MNSYSNPSANLEALLFNACRRAMGLGLSFTDQIRLYRSIVALAREVRLRAGGARLDAGNETLSALLAEVCEHAGAVGLDADLPLPHAILVQRLVVQLSRASRLVGTTGRRSGAQHPVHREEHPPSPAKAPARPDARADHPPQHPLHREDQPPSHAKAPARPDARADIPPQHPLHRENQAPDADAPLDDLDTPRPVDFRVKISSGDPARDAMSRRYRPDEDIDAAFAQARQQSAEMAAMGAERKRYA